MRVLATAVFCATLAVGAAQAQNGALFEEGQSLYEQNCVLCHQPSGKGNPPIFPALSGNDNISDLGLIVTNVHEGQGNMPAFPTLDAGDIAALATYIRNAWDNDHGAVTEEEIAALLGDGGVSMELISVWDGVYDEDQAKGVHRLYLGACASCHGDRLDGTADNPDLEPGPPLAGRIFLRNWDGQTLETLYEYMRTQMPLTNPGQLSDQQYADVIAYMLFYDDIPAGDEKLPGDREALSKIVIKQAPEDGG